MMSLKIIPLVNVCNHFSSPYLSTSFWHCSTVPLLASVLHFLHLCCSPETANSVCQGATEPEARGGHEDTTGQCLTHHSACPCLCWPSRDVVHYHCRLLSFMKNTCQLLLLHVKLHMCAHGNLQTLISLWCVHACVSEYMCMCVCVYMTADLSCCGVSTS